jgi:hypothetical protein
LHHSNSPEQGLGPRTGFADLDRDALPCYTKLDEVEKGHSNRFYQLAFSVDDKEREKKE